MDAQFSPGIPLDSIESIETILVKGKPDNKITVFVKTLTGKTLEIQIKPTASVITLKSMVQSKEGIPQNQQRLVFAGRELVDDHYLYDSNIQHESILHSIG